MSKRKPMGLKLGMLGVATTGFLWQALPASAQTQIPNPQPAQAAPVQHAPAQINRPTSRFDIGRRNSVPRRLNTTQNTNSTAMPAQPQTGMPVQQAPAALPVTTTTMPLAPATAQPNVMQTSAANSGKSEVQKQLEALYQADGREVPDMTFNLQPLNPQGGVQQQGQPQQAAVPAATAAQPNTRRVQGYSQYQTPKQTAANPYPAQPITPSAPQSMATAGQVNAAQSNMAQAKTEPAAEQPQQGPYRPNPVLKFFKKLNGKSSPLPQAAESPVPPDYVGNQATSVGNQAISNQAPVATAVPATQATTPQANRPANVSPNWSLPAQAYSNLPPTTTPQAAPTPPVQAYSQTPPVLNTVAPQPLAPRQPIVASTPHRPAPRAMMIPALSDSPLPIQQTASANSTTPKAKVQPQTQPVIAKKAVAPVETVEGNTVVETSVDAFDPFPDGSEADADVKVRPGQPEPIAVPATIAITPKSEMDAPKSIEAPVEAIVEVLTETPATTEVTAKDEDNPFAVEAKDFLEPVIAEAKDPAAPSLDGEPALVAPPADDAKPANEPEPLNVATEIDAVEEMELVSPTVAPLEKMKRIRERFGMKGLKGFCPVTLRDDRELIDARPEFFATHRGQKFHFASEEARDAFEESPSRYVPAAYGADVVALSRDKDVVEGTLDYASWYKGRLYLFGSQENYDVFISEPTQFTTIDGLE